MTDRPGAAELYERLRLIALEMHGLAGFADACEDAGDHEAAEQVRDVIAKVRALIPGTADPAAFEFQWATQFTAVDGRKFTYPMGDEAEARETFEGLSAGWAVVRRSVGGWEVVDA